MDPSQRTLSTAVAAARLGVSPATLRRYLQTGLLREPGWTRVGQRRQRAYSEQWLHEAVMVLEGKVGKVGIAPAVVLTPTFRIEHFGRLAPVDLADGAVVKLTIDAELTDRSLAGVAGFLAGLNDLYATCLSLVTMSSDHATVPTPSHLQVAVLSLASPLHIAAAGKATQETAQALHGVAGTLETIATLKSKRRVAQAHADVAEGTVEAKIAQENAAARKVVAEAEGLELDNRGKHLELLRTAAEVGRLLGDTEILDAARQELREMLGLDAAATQAALEAMALVDGVQWLEATVQVLGPQDADHNPWLRASDDADD